MAPPTAGLSWPSTFDKKESAFSFSRFWPCIDMNSRFTYSVPLALLDTLASASSLLGQASSSVQTHAELSVKQRCVEEPNRHESR